MDEWREMEGSELDGRKVWWAMGWRWDGELVVKDGGNEGK